MLQVQAVDDSSPRQINSLHSNFTGRIENQPLHYRNTDARILAAVRDDADQAGEAAAKA